jgi:peptidoglycan/LPS O-acetylase OafA/YrhL
VTPTLSPPTPAVQAPAPVHPAPARPAFRHDVEGLRAVAVLLVVGFHAGVPVVPGGYVGVDVFFVLSGYLITGLLVREIEERGRVDLAHFYARRARRLLPGAALMTLATSLAAYRLLSPQEQLPVSEAAGAASTWVSNLWFMWRVGAYVVTGIEAHPLLHTWSLAVEEQFYLVWPVAVWLMFRTRSRTRLAVCVAAVSLASLALCLWLTEVRQPWAFYASPARGWEFGIGGLAALLPAGWLAARHRVRAGLAWLGLTAVAVAAVVFTQDTRFPGAYAAVPALGTAAVLVAGAGAPGAVQKLLHLPVLQHLGRLSYSWYLWHWPALVLAAVVVPELGVPGRLLVSAGALGVAALAYAAVEHPIRSHPWLVARPRASLRLAGVLTAVSLAAIGVWNYTAGERSRSPAFRAYTDVVAEETRYACMPPMMDDWRPPCVDGNLASATTLVLFGDSHAVQWHPALERIAQRRGWKLVTLAKPACPAADVEVVNPRLRRAYVECTRWRARALRHIRELRPAAVVMASARFYVSPNRQSRVSPAQWRDGTRRTVAALDSLGIPTLLLHDTPSPPVDVPDCLARATHRGRDPVRACTMPRARVVREDARLAEHEAIQGLGLVTSVDPTEWLCTGPVCEPVRDGMVIYRDHSHLAPSYARHLVPALMPRLDAAMGAPAREAKAAALN